MTLSLCPFAFFVRLVPAGLLLSLLGCGHAAPPATSVKAKPLEPVMHFPGLFGLRGPHIDGSDQQSMPFGFSVASRLIYNGAQTRLLR